MSRIMRRPVKCAVCKKQMYYHGQRKHVPEVEVEVKSGEDSKLEVTYYIHEDCWAIFRKMFDRKTLPVKKGRKNAKKH